MFGRLCLLLFRTHHCEVKILESVQKCRPPKIDFPTQRELLIHFESFGFFLNENDSDTANSFAVKDIPGYFGHKWQKHKNVRN